ncbi:dihydrolipoyl dehydrogenase [Mariniblastus fucicola]|uniref:Dihydrolipoyl dehydrogenase n=1 Tax=Mariniblastus fucicola TaxID=980251 RepID=A0A5B9PFQ4_9BACT|nr:dihydrolipoyl dehydrogenase [Mariniblastus fucicola]QEG21781.1 Dihydrolipoyl dehydrogenase [Mariniblastus fucicola]
MADNNYDLVVLGGGPGGYVAAIRGAQLGLKSAVIDENQKFGGTCLRVGCIPSKALLESSHLLVEARDHMMEHGITATKLTVDLAAMMRRKSGVVDTLTGGVAQLLKKNKVKAIVGRGKLVGQNQIEIAGGETITAKNIIIATGSVPMALPGIELDGDRVGDSTAALSYTSVPRKLVVVGGGYIGLELGSVWSRLGSEVIILEAMDKVLGGLDQEIARTARRTFEKQGLQFRTGMWVESVVRNGDKCTVNIKGGETIECDRVLVAAGRSPNTKSIGLDVAGVEVDQRGFIVTDSHMKTSVDGIYAVGDCIGGAMLAHKASEEGIAVVEHIATGVGHVSYDTIPAIVYTHPEIASVGRTEEQLKAEGVNYKKGSCPFGANGRARAMGSAEGKIKILADADTDRILGVHAIGPRAGDLIAEAAVAMNFGASSEDLARCCHAHPTLSEIMQEAALAVSKRAIHT